jgi:hypothetical protein
MDSIRELKENKQIIGSEAPIETLMLAPLRYDLENEANAKIEQVALREVYQPVKKEDELASLIKMIVPSNLKTTLLQSTVSQKIKNQQRVDDKKNKDKAPIYDYSNKFSYAGYLRDEKIPPTIYSNHQDQPQKQKIESDSSYSGGPSVKKSKMTIEKQRSMKDKVHELSPKVSAKQMGKNNTS